MKFWIRNRPEHVPEAGNRLARACAGAGLDPMGCYQAQVCVVEAINNAIQHAYRDHDGYIGLRWSVCGGRIVIEVVDQGASMATPVAADPPDPMQENGRGWYIIRQWMDEADYRRRGNENVLTMVKHLTR